MIADAVRGCNVQCWPKGAAPGARICLNGQNRPGKGPIRPLEARISGYKSRRNNGLSWSDPLGCPEPLSARLRGGVRFFRHPLPPRAPATLAGHVPRSQPDKQRGCPGVFVPPGYSPTRCSTVRSTSGAMRNSAACNRANTSRADGISPRCLASPMMAAVPATRRPCS